MSRSTVQTDLFSPARVGALEVANRIVMAPLTRSRAGAEGVPNAMMAEYYAQRASAGLIVSEATNISPTAKGYVFTPGIYTEAQVAGWKQVTEAVHAKGGRIVLQLWHVGRISHPDIQPNGELPVAPSAINPQAQVYTPLGFKPTVTPRALETAELPGIVADYRKAAENAKRAGFDGVEIHAANAYLLGQFLSDRSNRRTDAYGGSIENRARLPLEVVEAVTAVWGGDRVGIRFSPVNPNWDALDSNPQALYDYVVKQLNRFGLAYIHVVEGATGGARDVDPSFDFQALRRAFNGTYIANNGYTRELALEARAEDRADLICFGKPFISNPDLVERLRSDAPLAAPDQATMYGGDAHGYTDYPFLGAEVR